MTTYSLTGGEMDDVEAIAAIAAVTLLLEAEAAATSAEQPLPPPAGWSAASRLIVQGLAPTRVPAPPRWNTIERLRRAGRSRGGVVGQ